MCYLEMLNMIIILNLISLQLVKHGYTQNQIHHFFRCQVTIFAMLIAKKGCGVAICVNNYHYYKVSDNLSFTIIIR